MSDLNLVLFAKYLLHFSYIYVGEVNLINYKIKNKNQ